MRALPIPFVIQKNKPTLLGQSTDNEVNQLRINVWSASDTTEVKPNFVSEGNSSIQNTWLTLLQPKRLKVLHATYAYPACKNFESQKPTDTSSV